jgi:hypothetical protein
VRLGEVGAQSVRGSPAAVRVVEEAQIIVQKAVDALEATFGGGLQGARHALPGLRPLHPVAAQTKLSCFKHAEAEQGSLGNIHSHGCAVRCR